MLSYYLDYNHIIIFFAVPPTPLLRCIPPRTPDRQSVEALTRHYAKVVTEAEDYEVVEHRHCGGQLILHHPQH